MIAFSFDGPPPRARRTLSAALLVALAVSACGGLNVSSASPAAPSSEPSGPSAAASDATPAVPTPDVPCAATSLVARVIRWEGAAGSRIASVDLANAGSVPCLVFPLDLPQLLDGNATLLIEGTQPSTSQPVLVQPGAVLRTEVRASNYCGPDPAAPVTVAFVIPDGLGRVVAVPMSATDTGGIPPCNGAAGSPGSIDMQPWAP